jgi:prepilin-type N-terminal cleavage/methylation domain-containing protein
MKKRGFTLIELVVTIAVIALLMLILVPILKRIKYSRIRAACANNISTIGKTMFIYANDYDDEYPRAAGPNSTWGTTLNWRADSRNEAYSLDPGSASISASLFLLVKYSEALPESFICPSDTGATEFIPGDYNVGKKKLIDLWDFGPDPSQHVSYAYHMPYSRHPVKTSSHPRIALIADRNPWLDSPGYSARPPGDLTAFDPKGFGKTRKRANSLIHQQDGQNALFNDSHIGFYATAACGVRSDNIYTSHNGPDIQRGIPPTLESQPADANDSLLVHDPPRGGGK